MMKFICLLACIAYVIADIAPGRNTYLPPDKGYSYDKPNVPFLPSSPPNIPTPRPPIVPRPPAPRPPPQTPTYLPPAPPTQPPTRPNYPTTRPSGPGPTHHDEHHHHHEPGMPFDFQYSVNDVETANDYTHKAVSDGDVTRGEYRVQLPDGRTQIVRYTADWKNGYNAEVSYEGEARYPDGPFGRGGNNNNNNNNQGYRY